MDKDNVQVFSRHLASSKGRKGSSMEATTGSRGLSFSLCMSSGTTKHSAHSEPSSTRAPSGSSGNTAVGTVQWWPCPQEPAIDCGTIVVPKDYFNSSAGTATIAVAKKKATKFPKRGSVMLNPGGPGAPGTTLPLLLGSQLAKLIGDDWDLVGFDPRGIGSTVPKVQCFVSTIWHHTFLANTLFEQGITIPSTSDEALASPRTQFMLIEQQRQFLALKKSQAEMCSQNMDVEELRYMGTATVVRDMDFMTQLLEGEGAKINYFGGSYGSILGAYLVNMLPHRVDYVHIDGIADPIAWANEPSHLWHKGWVSSAEKAYSLLLHDCSEAGPKLCPLANHTSEAPDAIMERIESFFDYLVTTPLAVPFGNRPGYLTSGAARGLLFIALMVPRSWPAFSHALALGMAGDGTALLNSLLTPLTTPPGHSGGADLARLAVTCLDSPAPDFPSAEELADENLRALREGSRHFGVSPIITEPDGGCEFWPVKGRAPEVFRGPWNATLERPMLIISNTADPITPIKSGLLVNSHMPNSSTLLIQNGAGHCSLAFPSLCTAKMIHQYWAGQPPKNGTVCELTGKTFPDPEKTGHNQDESLSAEDSRLLKAVEEIGAVMQELRRPGSTILF